MPPLAIVLANPGVALPTASVFQRRSGAFSSPARFPMPGSVEQLAALLAARRNDLAEAAVALVPEIGGVLARLEEGALLARMSGSGATCFGLYAAREAAEQAAARLRRDRPRWWVAAGRLS